MTFIRSQFYSKSYEVRILDCYQVLPTTIVGANVGPIRGLPACTKPHLDIYVPFTPPQSTHDKSDMSPYPPVPSAISTLLEVPSPLEEVESPEPLAYKTFLWCVVWQYH